MDKKYYELDEEDFYIGAIMEELTDERDPSNPSSWSKFTIDNLKDLQTICSYNSKYIGKYAESRIKFLDKEDIESLGFKYDNYYKTESYSKDLIGSKLGYSVVITKCYGNEYCIYHIHPDGNKSVIFRGVIKNLSILKNLLSQLNVD